MKKLSSRKSFLMILGGLTVLIIIFLAAGISGIIFQPGHIYQIEQPASVSSPLQPAAGLRPGSLLDVIIWAALILMGVSTLLVVLDPKQRKKFLSNLLRVSFLIFIISLLVSRVKSSPPSTPATPAAVAPAFEGLIGNPGEKVPPYSPPSPASWVVYMAGLGLVLGIGGLIYWGSSLYRRSHRPGTLEEFAGIVRSTIKEIRSGDDWENAIVQCYIRMNSTVSIRRSISRQVTVTPTEFAQQLESAGLPREAVGRLTLLFERVRCGGKDATPRDIQEALDCLTAILHACGEAV